MKPFTTEPKSTRSPKKNESASMPSSSPKSGNCKLVESTELGYAIVILAGSGSSLALPFIPKNGSSYTETSSIMMLKGEELERNN